MAWGRKSNTAARVDAYQILTDRFIEALENGTAPWARPWAMRGVMGRPHNAESKRPYRGVNAFWLSFVAAERGYGSSAWLTFNAARKLGGCVMKGEKGQPVVYFKFIDVQDKETQERKRIPFIRYFTVFNVAQCEGLPESLTEIPAVPEFSPIETAEKLHEAALDALKLSGGFHLGNAEAYYKPLSDSIHMPHKGDFKTPAHYYGTAFHEMAHATGHSKRLDRGIMNGFGSDPYAKEELVAEMTAAFLLNEAGILSPELFNHNASYLASWASRFKNDRKLIVSAASAAQRAADLLMGEAVAEEEEAQEEAEAVAA